MSVRRIVIDPHAEKHSPSVKRRLQRNEHVSLHTDWRKRRVICSECGDVAGYKHPTETSMLVCMPAFMFSVKKNARALGREA